MSTKGKLGCPHCNGTGYVAGSWGLQTLCSCVIDQLNEQTDDQPQQITHVAPDFSGTLNVHIQNAINDGILTENDLELEYSREYALKSLAERCEALHLKISKQAVMDCLDTMDGIITGLRVNQLPTKSYAIGIENGIGKTTFAITALKIAAAQGMKIVPFTDMSTLAEKYLEYSYQIMDLHNKSKNGYLTDPTSIRKKNDWRDYVEADLCFVSLTGGNANIAYLELDTLMTLLARRSDNRRPTIVLMRTPIEYYTKFDDVRKYLIKEVFSMNNKPGTYKMLERRSMFTREPSE